MIRRSMSAPVGGPATLLRLEEVCRMVRCHPLTLRRWIKAGRFPAPIQFSSRAQRWCLQTIVRFIESATCEAPQQAGARFDALFRPESGELRAES